MTVAVSGSPAARGRGKQGPYWSPAALAVALAIWAAAAWWIQPPCLASSDFYAFWAAARLADSRMYDPAAVEALQRSECPEVRSKRFIRPAIEGLALYPLGQLPYRTAYAIWFALNAGACLAVLGVSRRKPAEILAAALYAPLVWNFGLAQDAPLLLFAFTAGVRLIAQGRPSSGGALLALCLVKPNIFFAAPLVVASRKQWRALGGMAVTSGAMYLAAAAAVGYDWPIRFLKAALENENVISPNIVGLAGLIPDSGRSISLKIALAAAGAVLTLAWTRRQTPEAALHSALAAGLVFGPRAMIYDGAFLLPTLLSRLKPSETVVAGLALSLVVTPARPLVELASPAWLWLAASARSREAIPSSGPTPPRAP